MEVGFVDQEGSTLGVEKVSAKFLHNIKEARKMKKNKKSSIKVKVNELIEYLAKDPQVQVKNPDKVKEYLIKFNDILDIVPKAINTAKKHFPEAKLVFSFYKDPEIDDKYLVLYVRLKEYKEDLITRINKAESEFWDDLVDKKGYIFLTTDFQKPEE